MITEHFKKIAALTSAATIALAALVIPQEPAVAQTEPTPVVYDGYTINKELNYTPAPSPEGYLLGKTFLDNRNTSAASGGYVVSEGAELEVKFTIRSGANPDVLYINDPELDLTNAQCNGVSTAYDPVLGLRIEAMPAGLAFECTTNPILITVADPYDGLTTFTSATVDETGAETRNPQDYEIATEVYSWGTPDASVEVKKFINGQDASTAPGVPVDPATLIRVVFEVTNTGAQPLRNVALWDMNYTAEPVLYPMENPGPQTIPGVLEQATCLASTLAPGETTNCSLPASSAGPETLLHLNQAKVHAEIDPSQQFPACVEAAPLPPIQAQSAPGLDLNALNIEPMQEPLFRPYGCEPYFLEDNAFGYAHADQENSISLVKSINADDANISPGVNVSPNSGTGTITFEITNTGSHALTEIILTDDTIDPATMKDAATGNAPDPATVLQPGQSVTFTAALPVLSPGQYHQNTATVTAKPTDLTLRNPHPVYSGSPYGIPIFEPQSAPLNIDALQNQELIPLWPDSIVPTETSTTYEMPAVQDTDVAYAYYPADQQINVIKSINGNDADASPGVEVAKNSMLDINFTVTNTGTVSLTNIILTDNMIADGEMNCAPPVELAPGASFTCDATYPAPPEGFQHTNTASVSAQDKSDPNVVVSDSDEANAWVPNPFVGIQITDAIQNPDGSVTLNFSDGTMYVIPAGQDGTSIAVASTITDANGDTVVTLTDGTVLTIPAGEDGVDGVDGVDGTGVTIVSTVVDASGNTTLTMSDGTVLTIPAGINGNDGTDGADGVDGTSVTIVSTAVDEFGNNTVTFSDGTTVVIPAGQAGADGENLTIVDTAVDADGNTIVTMSDGTKLTLAAGADGAALTITDQRVDIEGNTVLTFSDGTVLLIPAGQAAAALTIVSTAVDANGNTVVTMSDGTSFTIPAGQDGANLEIVSNRIDANGDTVLTFSDGTVVIIKAGQDGEDGVDGVDGKDGQDGVDGVDGKDGQDGIDGVDGKDGQDGVDGVDGQDGEDGVDGVDGKDGVGSGSSGSSTGSFGSSLLGMFGLGALILGAGSLLGNADTEGSAVNVALPPNPGDSADVQAQQMVAPGSGRQSRDDQVLNLSKQPPVAQSAAQPSTKPASQPPRRQLAATGADIKIAVGLAGMALVSGLVLIVGALRRRS